MRTELVLLWLLAAAAVPSVYAFPWSCSQSERRPDWSYTDGSDLSSARAQSADHCQALCCSTPGCTAFTFNSDSSCLLKNGPRKGSSKSGSVSGTISKNYGQRNSTGGEYLGCWRDSAVRAMPWHAADATASNCRDACAALPAAFSSSENGAECWCGDTYGRYPRLDERQCDAKCNGDRKQACGGTFYAGSVWSTGYAVVDRSSLPAARFVSFPIDVTGNKMTFNWEWEMKEWNPFSFCNEFYLSLTDERGAWLERRVDCVFRSDAPATVAQSLSEDLANVRAGKYTAVLRMHSARDGDAPREATAPVCIPSAPSATTTVSPATGEKVASQKVKFVWKALSSGDWGTGLLCGAQERHEYNVFVGKSADKMELKATTTEAAAGLQLSAGDYFWTVVPSNGARMAHAVSDPSQSPIKFTVLP